MLCTQTLCQPHSGGNFNWKMVVQTSQFSMLWTIMRKFQCVEMNWNLHQCSIDTVTYKCFLALSHGTLWKPIKLFLKLNPSQEDFGNSSKYSNNLWPTLIKYCVVKDVSISGCMIKLSVLPWPCRTMWWEHQQMITRIKNNSYHVTSSFHGNHYLHNVHNKR